MTEISNTLLITGGLVLVSILASRLSNRFGIPALLVFLGIGMLAGSDGPGGIHFDDALTANTIGTIALAYILFAGGIETNWTIVRPVFARGAVLATLGVFITAVLVGLFVWGVLGFPITTGLLIGAIISSTDAAAVFSVLRGRGVGLKGNLKPLLELESGSNDPMAVFLTLGMTSLITQPDFSPYDLAPALLLNMAVGVIAGIGIGKLGALLFNRVRLENEGLYPVLSMSLVLLIFGLTEFMRGNGFLAVYISGIILNGTDFAYKQRVIKFHDGLAWLMQIAMFLVLGLLVFPSQLPSVVTVGLPVALFLMFVARPIAVYLGLAGSAFSWPQRTLVAWTGLRGAVPIVLATFPFLAGYENSPLVFNVVVFTVLASILVQGTLLMPVARLLRVDEPLASRPSYTLEIERYGQAQGETREIEIGPNMAVVGRTVADIAIPQDVVILLIGRGDGYVVPRGKTRIEPYDTLLLLGHAASLRAAAEAINEPPPPAPKIEGPFDPLAALPMSTDQKFLSKQVVVVGHGRVGSLVCKGLAERGVPYVVADQRREIIEKLRDRGVPAVLGDASEAIVLAQAHIAKAALLIIATPDTMKVRTMAEIARTINPTIHIVIRCHSEVEAALLEREHTGTVFIGERELARSILRHVINQVSEVEKAAQDPQESSVSD